MNLLGRLFIGHKFDAGACLESHACAKGTVWASKAENKMCQSTVAHATTKLIRSCCRGRNANTESAQLPNYGAFVGPSRKQVGQPSKTPRTVMTWYNLCLNAGNF